MHFHALVAFTQKLKTRDTRYFDIGRCHPNIKPIPTGLLHSQRVWDYCTKDGDFSGEYPRPERRGTARREEIRATWADAIASSSKEEFINKLKENEPKYVTFLSFYYVIN